MQLLESGQMYLEALFVLSLESDMVRAIDIGEYLGYSKPSVSRALVLLKDEGYLTKDDKGFLHLTDKGKKIAEDVYDRHTVLTELFIMMGVRTDTANQDACRVEHYISEETFKALKTFVKEHSQDH